MEVALQICDRLLNHAQANDEREGKRGEVPLIGADLGKHLEDHVHKVETIDHLGKLEEKTSWDEGDQVVPRAFDDVGVVKVLALHVPRPSVRFRQLQVRDDSSRHSAELLRPAHVTDRHL